MNTEYDERYEMVKVIMQAVDDMAMPWKQKKTGRPSHPPKALAVVGLFKLKSQLSYRETEKFFKSNGVWKIVGLKRPIGKSTIQETVAKLPEKYIEKVEQYIDKVMKN